MFLFALKNILRNKARSLITAFAILFSAFLILSIRFLNFGVYNQSIKNALSITSGFIVMAANGWMENPSIERALETDEQTLASIQNIEGVDVISPRIEGSAMASFKGNSSFISVKAADPQKEKQITTLYDSKIKGKHLDSLEADCKIRSDSSGAHPASTCAACCEKYFATMGEALANDLEIETGDTFSLVSSQFDGSLGAILVQLAGIYQTLDEETNANTVFLPLAGGRELFGLDISLDISDESSEALSKPKVMYTSITLGIQNQQKAKEVYHLLSQKFPKPPLEEGEERGEQDNYDMVAHFWPEIIPGLVQMIALDSVQNEIVLFFIILVMAFGVLNTVQMSIQERKRELGVLIALGTKQMYLIRLLLTELLILLVPAMLIGSGIAIGLGSYLYANPIPLSAELSEAYAAMGFIMPEIQAQVSFQELGIGVASLLMPSFLLALISMRRIFQIKPAEVLVTY